MVTISKASCARCSRFLGCNDPKKVTPRYKCDRFIRLKEVDSLLDLPFAEMVPRGESDQLSSPGSKVLAEDVPEEASDGFVWDAMQRAYDPEINMIRDLRVDHSELPFARNYYQYCAKVVGPAVKMPFARQLWLCLMLLGEVCPRCTNPKWLNMWNVPVDMDSHELGTKRLRLFRHGVCPRCSATKWDCIQAGEMKDYTEAVWVLGQRGGKCLVEGTLIQTDRGLIPVERLCAGNSGGWGSYQQKARVVLESGDTAKISRTYVSKRRPVMTVALSDGRSITGTKDHPLFTNRGWVPLQHLTRNDWLPIPLGQMAFNSQEVDFSELKTAAEIEWTSYLAAVQEKVGERAFYDWEFPATSLNEEVAFLIGLYLAEGHCDTWNTPYSKGLSISNQDHTLLARARKAALSLYPGIAKDNEGSKEFAYDRWGFRNVKAAIHFNLLTEGALRVKSASKKIPSCILQSPKHVQRSFLQAMFEGDGCLNSGKVEYTSISKDLVEVLQVMLGNFGVYGTISSSWSWASNGSDKQVSKPVYNLKIQGAYPISNFQSEIGFLSDRKKRELDKVLTQRTRENKRNNPDLSAGDSLPPHLAEEWLALDARVKESLDRAVESGFTVTDKSGRTTPWFRRSWLKGAGSLKSGWCNVTRHSVSFSLERLKQSVVWCALPDHLQDDLQQFHDRAIRKDIMWVAVDSVTPEGTAKTYDIEVPGPHRFLANGVVSHNSTTASMLTTYVFHRMLKSPKLGKVARGIQESTQLTASFVALSVTNAYKLLWTPVRDVIVDSAWFKAYFDFMDYHGKRMGKELYQFNPTGTYFRSFLNNIDAFPSGPSKRNLRGPTRLIAVTDELGHFPFNPLQDEDEEGADERERANADEVHMVLTNSLATVRGEIMHQYTRGVFTYPQAFNISISSPASWRDKIMRLLAEAETSNDMLGMRAATWEISPLFPRTHPVITSMYAKNPRKAERDFGANPPRLSSNIFTKDAIQALFDGMNAHAVMYDLTEPSFTRAKAVVMHEPANLPASLMSLDAGLTNNAFAITVLHPIKGDEKMVGHYRASTILEVVAQPNTQIDFVFLYENIIWPMIQAFNVREVYADRWNSAYILRLIETQSKGQVKAFNYSLRGKDFNDFIQFVNACQLHMPKIEISPDVAELTIDFKKDLIKYPAAHLYRQFLTVQQYQGMLVKGSDSTDDMFRSLVLATTRFFDPKVVERFKTYPDRVRGGMSSNAVVLVGGRGTNYGIR